MQRTKFLFLVIGFLAWQAAAALADEVTNRIAVTVRGQGPDVVLIPGLACSNAVWDATAAHFEKHYRLHLVQVAGFGGSLPRANAQGPVVQPTVEAIDAYIKTHHLKAPRVIGHSLGGLMGLMLAARHPEDVGRLMVVDSLPFFSVLFGAKDVEAATPQAAGMRDNILTETQAAYAQGEKEFLRSLVKSTEGRQAATTWAIASEKSVVARALYEILTTDLRPQLREIKIPVTILYAWDASTSIPQTLADGLYRDNYAPLPDKTLVRIEDSCHFIMLDQPERFAAQAEAFLQGPVKK
jgi:pimeloyl-ACP methyl ester carboxylesterase